MLAQKFFIVAISITALSNGANAQSQQDQCTVFSQVAAQIMTARQNGVPLSRMISVPETTNETQETKAALKNLTVLAYKVPRYNTEAAKRREITEFSNNVMLGCLQGN